MVLYNEHRQNKISRKHSKRKILVALISGKQKRFERPLEDRSRHCFSDVAVGSKA